MPDTDKRRGPDAPARITLAHMGSFHIGGRRLDVQGHPVVMQQLASNGVPARFDPTGGYLEQDPRGPQLRQRGLAFAERACSAGGRVDVIDLPALGIEGNSHMLMMERNNGEIAALIRRWLRARALESSDGRNPAV